MSKQTEAKRTEMGRLLFLSGVGILVLWAWGYLGSYFELLGTLRAQAPIERAYLALDPSQNFLTLAGRPDRRASLSELRDAARLEPHAIAQRWQWAVRVAETLPADARIYLNTPNTQLYFHGSFLWYPARIEVSSENVIIRDPKTLQDAQHRVSPARYPALLTQGYTHILTLGTDGPRLIALGRSKRKR